MNIAASGGSSTILCHASRTRNYTWNGVGTTYTETENGSPTLSKSGDGTLSGTTSGSKLTYGNRTTTTGRSTTVTATYSGVSKSINITHTAIMNAGKLQFWFEDKNGSSNKYTCTLSSVSTPSNNVSVSNSNNIITVTANTTTSSFTILCQFTMTSNSTLFNVRVLIEP